MPDFTVARRGTDSSGRGIFATAYMWEWWQALLERPRIAPFAHKIVITQGAFMTLAGGGAKDSAGYHDKGGTFDLRVWNLEEDEVAVLVDELRESGAAAWLRNTQHGGFEDPHIHFVLGTDQPLSAGASHQWDDYKAGRDGLATDGPDYHPRPKPLVLTPPEEMFMPTAEEIANAVWARQITPVGSDTKIAAAQMLRQIHNRTAGIKDLSAAVAQVDPSIDQAALERALAKVLGSLDD
jgi:hypothetical protein